MKLTVLQAGVGEPSSTRLLADRLQGATTAALTDGGSSTSGRVIDVRTLAHDAVDAVLTRVQSPELRAAVTAVEQADGLIAVAPTFAMSYSGLFKSFMDLIDKESLTGVPVLLAATGGTERHSMVLDTAMRPLFTHLKALTLPTAVYAAAQDWGSDALERRIDRAGRELATMMLRLPARTAIDPFDPGSEGFVSFSELLGR